MANARQHRRTLWPIQAITLGLAVAAAALGADRLAKIDVEATLKAVARYRYGDERKPLADLKQLVLRATSLGAKDANGFRRDLADRMAGLLTSKDATPAAKALVCGQLATIATARQAPALASLLADADKEVAKAALAGLAQVPGPAVDRILCDALGTLQGDLRIGAINALGQRRDRAAAEPLIAILAGGDEASACAAADALGDIGGDAAAAALQRAVARATGRLRTAAVQACLACADQLLAEKKATLAAALYAPLSRPTEAPQVRMAALRGTVRSNPEKAAGVVCRALLSGDPALENMAISLVPELPGAAAREQVARCLGKTPPAVQALVVGALAAGRDTAARDAAMAAAASHDPAVRLAAIRALGVCGDEAAVILLVDRMAAGQPAAESEAARHSLARLPGKGIDQVLARMIAQRDARTKAELIRILAARNAVSAIGDLKKAAEDPDVSVRKEAWKALAVLAKGPEVASLVDLLLRARDDGRGDAEKAVAEVLKKSDRPDARAVLEELEAARSPAARASLVRIVSMVGDDAALPALRKALQSKDAGVRDAAVRGLAAWPRPSPLEDLLKVAREAKEPVYRVLALRAALRLSSQAQGQSPEQMTRFVGELMQLAREPAERKAVLAELGRCPTLDALRLAQHYLADPELATEAGVALTQIASALRDSHPSEVLSAVRPLLSGPRDPVVVGRACKVLKDILKPVNLALGATATNPDGLAADGAAGGPRAAIDGDPNTYWDETDNADLYRLRVTLRHPAEVSSINILWHPYEQYQAKNFDVLCDGKVVKKVRNAQCFENEMFLPIGPVRCTSVELVIPGKNGLVSPCIHELQIFSHFAEVEKWIPDLDEGKRRAAQEHKDLLVYFTGTEWCYACIELKRAVLNKPEFASAGDQFVLVELEFPQVFANLPKEIRAKYLAWRDEYGIRAFPTVILADATGRPYAVTGNIGLNAKQYVEHLRKLQDAHKRHRDAFEKAAKLKGIAKAQALDEALSALRSAFPDWHTESNGDPLVRFYGADIDQILSLDADNAAGLRDKYQRILDDEKERQRIVEFYRRVSATQRDTGDQAAVKLIDKELERTKSVKLRNRLKITRLGVLEGRHEEALDYARGLLKDESFSAEDRRRLQDRIAFHLRRLGRIDEAVAVCDALIAEAAGNPKALWSRYQDKAEVLRYAGRYSEALKTWDTALKLTVPGTTQWKETQWFRVLVMEKAGRYDDSVAVQRSLLSASGDLEPLDRAGALAKLAESLNKGGHREEALDSAHQAEQILRDLEVRSGDKKTVEVIRSRLKAVRGETGAKGAR